MRRQFMIILGILVLSSSFSFAEEGKKYGKGISLKKTTTISAILENPKSFVGKKVLVSGTIVGVCANKGCWIEVASDKEFEKIRVKVNDGEIVFPLTAKGHSVLAEGVVEEIIVPKEQAEKMEQKMAEKKSAMSKEKVEKGGTEQAMEGCGGCAEMDAKSDKTYRIKGIGAVIK